jgi:hypothetical protein
MIVVNAELQGYTMVSADFPEPMAAKIRRFLRPA